MTDIYTTQPAGAPPPTPGTSDNKLNLLIGGAVVFLVIALGVLGWVVIQGGGDGSQVATADTNEARNDRQEKSSDQAPKDQGGSGDQDSSAEANGDDQVTLPATDSTAPNTAGGGGTGTGSPPAAGTGGAGAIPRGTSQITPTDVSPSNTRESVPSLKCTKQPLSYGANQLIDSNPQTGWGASKHDGTGETVQFELGGTKQLSTVGITPGYLRVAERSAAGCSVVSAFPYNRFINSVRWEFSDGSSVEQSFENRGEMQSIDVDKQTSFVRMVILSTTRPAGADDDTVISEAQFTGTP